MTFCIFHDAAPGAQERKMFEIVEKSYYEKKKVIVFVKDAARAAEIDRLLWIMKQDSFIPHKIFEKNEPDEHAPVAIVFSEMNPIHAEVLVADGHCSLDFASEFVSINEFVNRSSPELHRACRDRYRDYRARQISVEYSK
jgi:DNA polymerase III subunit chi